MGLGNDNTVCKAEFVEAMRPIAGANVDLPEVEPNFGALGLAVFQIVTVRAEPRSDSGVDSAFWAWVDYVDKWATTLAAWRTAFQNWTPTQSAEQNLKAALLAAPAPMPPALRPPRPAALKVQIT
jgi:hypothetical protein